MNYSLYNIYPASIETGYSYSLMLPLRWNTSNSHYHSTILEHIRYSYIWKRWIKSKHPYILLTHTAMLEHIHIPLCKYSMHYYFYLVQRYKHFVSSHCPLNISLHRLLCYIRNPNIIRHAISLSLSQSPKLGTQFPQ